MTSYGEARLQGTPSGNVVEDLTHTSGLIVVFGLFAFLPGTIDLIGVSAKGVDWDGDADLDIFPPILMLLANIVLSLFGMVSIFVGFQYLASKAGSKLLSLFGLVATLAAWFPFTIMVALISYRANNSDPSAPLGIPYDPTDSEIIAVAIMAILGFYGYAGTVIGALTFLHWKMYRIFAGYAHTYTAAYYRSRASYYGVLTLMVGVVQLALGAYVKETFGDGELPLAIGAGPFFILFPELSITVGAFQFLLGIYLIYRSTTAGVGPAAGNKDTGLFAFQCFAWFVFLVSVGCQVIGQIALNEDPSPAVFLVNVVGFCLFPIYLDVMAHTTPENVTTDMFSTAKASSSGI